jgi:hypothetical protein
MLRIRLAQAVRTRKMCKLLDDLKVRQNRTARKVLLMKSPNTYH